MPKRQRTNHVGTRLDDLLGVERFLPTEGQLRAIVAGGLFDQLLLEEVGKQRAMELLEEAGRIVDGHSIEAVRNTIADVISRRSDPELMNEPVDFRILLRSFEPAKQRRRRA